MTLDIIAGENGDDALSGAMAMTGWTVVVAMMRSTVAQAMTGCKAEPVTTLLGATPEQIFLLATTETMRLTGRCDDVLEGGAGNDVMADGGGEDVVQATRATITSPQLSMRVPTCTHAMPGPTRSTIQATTLAWSSTSARVSPKVNRSVRDQISGFEAVIGGHGDDFLKSGHGSISMTGGEGDDTFEFEAPDQDHRGSLVRTITDFTVGDRLLVSSYEFRDHSGPGNAEDDDSFYDRYLSDEDNQRSIRFRFENHDDRDFTIISVTEGIPDDDYEIQLSGHLVFDVQDHHVSSLIHSDKETTCASRCELNCSRRPEARPQKCPARNVRFPYGRALWPALHWRLAWLSDAVAGRLLQDWKAPSSPPAR